MSPARPPVGAHSRLAGPGRRPEGAPGSSGEPPAPVSPAQLGVREFGDYSLVIDARSPHEYAEDHLPGAVNLPVVDDAQYAEVGIRHKVDKHAAYLIGVEYSLRNIADQIKPLISRYGTADRFLVYCLRGGKRSRLWADSLRTIGFEVDVLAGGWKRYRQWVRESLAALPPTLDYRVLAGPTGCGKTRLLSELARTGTISLRGFWARRIRRLLPAALTVLAVCAALTLFVLPAAVWEPTLRQITASAFYVTNWVLAADAVDYLAAENMPTLVQHYWSLAVEEQFYLIWPVLLLGAAILAGRIARMTGNGRLTPRGAIGILIGVIVAVSFAASLAYAVLSPAAGYFVTVTRAWELGIGGAIAWLRWGRPELAATPRRDAVNSLMSWTGIALILFSAVELVVGRVFPGWIAAVPVLGAGLVILGRSGSRFSVERLSSWRPIHWIGDNSYSIYLWHWPIIVAMPYVTREDVTLRWAPLVILLTAALAWATKVIIEDPVRFGPAWRSGRRSIALAAAGALALGSAQVGGLFFLDQRAQAIQATHTAFPSAERLADDIGKALTLTDWPEADLIPGRSAQVREWVEDDCLTVTDARLDDCAYGDVDSDRIIVIMGDSTALGWAAALRESVSTGYRLQLLTKAECPFADVDVRDWESTYGFADECRDHNDWALDQLERLDPAVVIVSNSPYTLTRLPGEVEDRVPLWRTALASSLADAAERVDTVKLFGISAPGRNPQECRYGSAAGIDECVADVDEQALELIAAERAAADRAGVEFVDTVWWFCSRDELKCPPVIDATLVKADGHHLSRTFAARLGKLVADAVLDEIQAQTPPVG